MKDYFKNAIFHLMFRRNIKWKNITIPVFGVGSTYVAAVANLPIGVVG